MLFCVNREGEPSKSALPSAFKEQEEWTEKMPGFAVAILTFTFLACIAATAVLCAAIERHNQLNQRRALFGLSPLNFP
jgi:hypothetical protein